MVKSILFCQGMVVLCTIDNTDLNYSSIVNSAVNAMIEKCDFLFCSGDYFFVEPEILFGTCLSCHFIYPGQLDKIILRLEKNKFLLYEDPDTFCLSNQTFRDGFLTWYFFSVIDILDIFGFKNCNKQGQFNNQLASLIEFQKP